MEVGAEIGSWIHSNRIDVNVLLKKLIEDAYLTAKLFSAGPKKAPTARESDGGHETT
ncbi:hypothetical protein QWY85_20140 [Neolewinella lacunae]|uniref:Uncharacterized protein n=1 Tax=Neolewinella lacunae TaxID=1517758 RepID=A0A923TAC1_9BACT|nr:hypothetical protein [Neolewinella lacunae]MBC6996369.1 hypothetical protein [Neolewinella lacunae]MDN3636992.1 hypothetical protein [Neolewinella lacunae]